MNLKYFILSIILTANLFCKTVTVKGYIEDNFGNQIPSAEIVFIDNTGDSTFTESNQDGYYEIELDVGEVPIDDNKTKYPDRFKLYQNYPNPFNPGTWIPFSLPRPNKVNICIYNLLGQKIKNIANKQFPSGKSKVYWDGTNNNGALVSGGIYFYSVNSVNFHDSKKMLLLDGGGSIPNFSSRLKNQASAKSSKSLAKTISSRDTFNIVIKKENFKDVGSEKLIINESDDLKEKSLTLHHKYHLCYNKAGNVMLSSFDGQYIRNLTEDLSGDCTHPDWSPNGRYIVFERSGSAIDYISIYDIFMDEFSFIDINYFNWPWKGEIATLLNSVEGWSPDGRIVFTIKKMGSNIGSFFYIVNRDGTNLKSFPVYNAPEDFRGLRFCNDSYHYFYKFENKLYKTNIDSTIDTLLFDCSNTKYSYMVDINPSNGDLLCYWENEKELELRIYNIYTQESETIMEVDSLWDITDARFTDDCSCVVYNYDSSELNIHKVYIYKNKINKELLAISYDDPAVWIVGPIKVSPNDSYLAFTKNVDNSGQWVSWNSYLGIINVETSEVEYIDDNASYQPDWNPIIDF